FFFRSSLLASERGKKMLPHCSQVLDGIPVKISERFKPPPRIQLPPSIVIPSEEVFRYNFAVEKNVLEAQARRLLEEEERLKEEAEAERIKQEVEAERLKQEAETELLKRDAEAERLKQGAERSEESPERIRQEAEAERLKNEESRSESQEKKPESVFPDEVQGSEMEVRPEPAGKEGGMEDSSGREDVRSKPFLSNSWRSPLPAGNTDLRILQPTPAYKEVVAALPSNSDAPSDLTLRKGAQTANNMSADLNFAEFEGSRDPFDNAELNTLNEIQELASVLCGPTLSVSYPQQPSNTPPVRPPVSNYANSPLYQPSPPLPPPYPNHWPSTSHQPSALPAYGYSKPLPFRTCVSPPPNPSDPLSYSSLRSKSVPDLMKELGSEFPQPYPPVALVNHSQVPRTVVPHMNPVPAIPKVPVLPPKPAQNRPRLACPSLKNPYLRLDAEGQKAVDTLVEMGFPWDSSARAVIAFGNDVKNVIEVLLLVESLQERGFPRHLVEHVALESQDKVRDEEVICRRVRGMVDGFQPNAKVMSSRFNAN
ncbi:unnamed protein product, partial [Cyprideis torosa]